MSPSNVFGHYTYSLKNFCFFNIYILHYNSLTNFFFNIYLSICLSVFFSLDGLLPGEFILNLWTLFGFLDFFDGVCAIKWEDRAFRPNTDASHCQSLPVRKLRNHTNKVFLEFYLWILANLCLIFKGSWCPRQMSLGIIHIIFLRIFVSLISKTLYI